MQEQTGPKRCERLRIATRASELALIQARLVARELIRIRPGIEIDLVRVKTAGDRLIDQPLDRFEGRGVFVKEVEEALIDGRADIAVHSIKDLPTILAPGLEIKAICRRGDPRDVWCCPSGNKPRDLVAGALIGTSSPRRALQLRALCGDLKIARVRGNVTTRLMKLEKGEVEGMVLAAAGLKRLGLNKKITYTFGPDEMVPAAGQGAIGVEGRQNDHGREWISALDHKETASCVRAERAFINRLGFGCQSPVGVLAVRLQGFDQAEIYLRAAIGDLSSGTMEVFHYRAAGEQGAVSGIKFADSIRCPRGT